MNWASSTVREINMQKFAVIDIGSNSVRLMFVADGKVLYKTLATTRLGEGIADSLRLKPEAIARSAQAVAGFHRRATEEGAKAVYAFATAAVRSAENGGEFLKAVKMLCGLEVQVLSGETEAEIGIAGALGLRDGAVIDVGGASTEIVVRKSGRFEYKKSVNVGVVRLKDSCGRDASKLYAASENAAIQFGIVPASPLYAIGGTATTLASLALGLTEYDGEKITGTVITATQMRGMADRLLQTPVEEIAKMPCMSAGRADVLAGGAALLATLMEKLGFESVTVSDRDNLEGYAIKMGLMV